MKINLQGISDRKQWEEKGFDLPQYDIAQMKEATMENPFWVHFGAGNLFRAFHASIAQKMLNEGVLDRGIVVAEGFDYEIIEKVYVPHDNLGISMTLRADGTVGKMVIGSVAEALPLDSDNSAAYARLREIFEKDSLQMVTFTITEKGYSLTDAKGEYLSEVLDDFAKGPEKPVSYMGKVTALLYARFCAGEKPVAMVSTDNCSHNGDRLYAAVLAFAEAWSANKKVDTGFRKYIDSEKVSFTWSMIDKITPRPDAAVEEILTKDGVEGLEPVITSRKTYTAPFVNAEETEYLVIEENFPNGRPSLEDAGVLFTNRETVDKVEKMKVCTCLNPLHTCLAIFGCLLGYRKIADEMRDEALVRLVEGVGYQEGLPVVVNPGIIDPKKFLDTVLNVRFPNPFMPDTPQRIATDTSQKLAIRFGETLRAYETSDTLKVENLQMIPLVYAGWLRYLMAVDDKGEPFDPSPDPMLEELRPQLEKIRLGDRDVEAVLRPIMENTQIFGVNLYKTGLAEKVCGYFRKLNTEPGAVRRTLDKLGTF
ncbi:MAG: mannitol dehydrogenase family protein [Lachnospiraceae bacterium]|nr:mannitol dehydrogenase family protein [Lachnospiraceae bacterium]